MTLPVKVSPGRGIEGESGRVGQPKVLTVGVSDFDHDLNFVQVAQVEDGLAGLN